MTDPKEVAARALALTKQIEAIFYHDQNPGGAVQVRSKVRALLTATALETLSSELERVKGERDQALEAEDEAKDCFWAIYPEWLELSGKPGITTEAARTALAARAERAEASLGVAVKALEPFAYAVFNDNGDVTLDMSDIGTKDYLRARSALASIQAKGV
jgi:hypothetical protein